MPAIPIQFHALREEIFEMLSQVLTDDTIFMAGGSEPGTRFELIEVVDRPALVTRNQISQLLLTLEPPILGASTVYDFLGPNPSALVIRFGEHTPTGLVESWLSTIADDETIIRWRRIARRFRRNMKTGATAFNPKTGARGPMFNGYRFSSGAQQAAQHGVTMLPFAGGTIRELPPLE